MSKLAHQRAYEQYPQGNDGSSARIGYTLGYDQAMQDFMEKAEKFFKNELYVSVSDQICSQNDFTSMPNFVKYFKNYIQNEN